MKVVESVVTGHVERKLFEELQKENENLKTQLRKKEEIISKYKDNLESVIKQVSIHTENCDNYNKEKVKNVFSTIMLLLILTQSDGKEEKER